MNNYYIRVMALIKGGYHFSFEIGPFSVSLIHAWFEKNGFQKAGLNRWEHIGVESFKFNGHFEVPSDGLLQAVIVPEVAQRFPVDMPLVINDIQPTERVAKKETPSALSKAGDMVSVRPEDMTE